MVIRFNTGRLLVVTAAVAVVLLAARWLVDLGEPATLAWVWILHAAIAGLLTAPIVFLSRRRVHWESWELSAFVLPFGIWALLFFSELAAGRKSIANLAEPFYFSFAIPSAAMLRAAIGRRPAERHLAAALIAGVCGVAAAVFFLVPSLPE